MMHWIQKSLYDALDEDEIRLLPPIALSKENPLLQESLTYYDQYKLYLREHKLYQRLGQTLPDKVKILDVGSGEGMTTYVFLSKMKDINIEYVSIDKSREPTRVIKAGFRNFKHTHMNVDIFDTELSISLLHDFDIVLIDVEPHGKEIEVYEIIKNCMKKTHLCILKHVSFIDLYGSCLIDRFIHTYYNDVLDYFAEYDQDWFKQVRDCFVVISSDHSKNIKCQDFAKGNVEKYVENGIRGYCLKCY